MNNESKSFWSRLFLGMAMAGTLAVFSENRDNISGKIDKVKNRIDFWVAPVADALSPENLHRLVPR